MGNPIQHFEWRTKDAARLQKFYSSIFSWKFSEPMPGYTMVRTGTLDGGIFPIPHDAPMQPGTCAHATVDDIAEYEEKIRAAGGHIVSSNQEVPGIGWFTTFVDPDGNNFAIWKAAEHPKKLAKKAKKEAKKAKKAAKKGKKDKKDKKK